MTLREWFHARHGWHADTHDRDWRTLLALAETPASRRPANVRELEHWHFRRVGYFPLVTDEHWLELCALLVDIHAGRLDLPPAVWPGTADSAPSRFGGP